MSKGVDLSKTRPAARRLGWRRHPAAAADLSKWSAFDGCGGRIHVRTASGPHVATIIYPQFSTTHFYLLITGLILTHIPESFNPNLVETQNIILNPKKRVGALLKFRVQETRKTCKIFIEMEEVLFYIWACTRLNSQILSQNRAKTTGSNDLGSMLNHFIK